MRAKKLLTAALAGMMTLGIMSVDMSSTQAATRAELGAISVSKKGNFKYWEKDSEAKAALVNYVKDVTNPRSKNFIPVEDRIAVFDLDGTLICETAPYYFEWMFYIHHDLNEPAHRATPAARKTAQEILDAIYAHKMTLELDEKERYGQAASFEGMTPEEYAAYVKNYMNTTYVEGLSNLKTGEGFYMPMVEVVSYLNANKFTC
ncbi:MAG: haloacid dehalogenase-like hydrolase, partial [Selenomonadaceae bacterium]|nr:haloacid dehalogenase-like hydrolase [Selenomonadaceae bacterium]